uniref:Uncharacterized protein n=1 Tax=Brassica campestris TaxID=3711 RepID=M4E2X0_BRACM
MFGLHKKSNQASKLQQHKQRNQRKRQNKFDDDEKMVRNGDCLFSKTKRSNCDVLDRNELQTYASLEKMLHKAIFAIQKLKKKGNTDTSSAPKQQCSSELIFQFEKNSKKVLNKNEFSGPLNAFDIGAYMTLVLEALCQYMKGQMKNKTVVIKQTKTDFLPFKSWTKLKVSNVLIMILLLITLFLLMFHLFEEGVNDAPQSMEPARHGDQDVLNDSTEVRPSDSTNQTNRAVYRIDLHSSKMEFRLKPRSDDQTDRTTTRFSRPPDILRTIVEPDLSWIVKNPKTDMHSHPANHPDSPACALLLTALDTTSSDEPRQ